MTDVRVNTQDGYLTGRLLCQYNPMLTSRQIPIKPRTEVLYQISLLATLPVSGRRCGLRILVGIGSAVAVMTVVSVGVGDAVSVGVIVTVALANAMAVWVRLYPPRLITAVRATVVRVGGTPADVGMACGPSMANACCGSNMPSEIIIPMNITATAILTIRILSFTLIIFNHCEV